MSKLELLAPYLPYELQVKIPDSETLYTLGCLLPRWNHVAAFIVPPPDEMREGFHVAIDHVIPCFRPFSQIDKPTLLNGRLIVPAVEIARLALGDGDWQVTSKNSAVVRIDSGSGEKIYFDLNWNIEVGGLRFTRSTYKIFQLLHRLHFAPPGLNESEYIAIGEGV